MAAGHSKDGQAGREAEGGRDQRQGAAARHAVGCALAPAYRKHGMVLLCTAGTWGKHAGSTLLMQSQGGRKACWPLVTECLCRGGQPACSSVLEMGKRKMRLHAGIPCCQEAPHPDSLIADRFAPRQCAGLLLPVRVSVQLICQKIAGQARHARRHQNTRQQSESR